MSTMSWKTIGNAAHFLNVGLVITYGFFVFASGKEGVNDLRRLDERWLEEGFCTPESDTNMKMHFDNGITLGLISCALAAYWFHRSKKTSLIKDSFEVEVDSYIKPALCGLMGHAIGHLLIYGAKYGQFYPDDPELRGIDDLRGDSIGEIVKKIVPGYFIFWIPVVKSYMQHSRMPFICMCALFALVTSLHLPIKFGFSFAQCFFFMSLSFDQMLNVPSDKKGFTYAIYPLMTVIPSISLAWAEASSCSSSKSMKAYGHLIYDVFMGLSYVSFYVLCKHYFKGSECSGKKLE